MNFNLNGVDARTIGFIQNFSYYKISACSLKFEQVMNAIEPNLGGKPTTICAVLLYGNLTMITVGQLLLFVIIQELKCIISFFMLY